MSWKPFAQNLLLARCKEGDLSLSLSFELFQLYIYVINKYKVPLSRILNDILYPDHIQ